MTKPANNYWFAKSRMQSVFFSLLFLIVTLLLSIQIVSSEQTRVLIGDFSNADLSHWEKKIFKNETHYILRKDHLNNYLEAVSDASASGLIKKIKVDLDKTPWLNWSWQVDKVIGHLDETTKQGDDYPARVYVIVDSGFTLWKTRTLNYVWSNNAPIGTIWPNAYAGNHAMMMALRSGDHQAGEWVHEKRNVQQDLKNIFGKDFHSVDAIAIMTDTDNSGGQVIARYGDIYFSAE